jgi:hypothetical protein
LKACATQPTLSVWLEVARLPRLHQRLELLVEADLLVELDHLVALDADRGPQLAVLGIGIGDQRIHAVVAALQFDQQQHALRRRLVGEGGAGGERHGKGAGAEEEIATVHGLAPHFNWYAESSIAEATTAPGEDVVSTPSIGARGSKVRSSMS